MTLLLVRNILCNFEGLEPPAPRAAQPFPPLILDITIQVCPIANYVTYLSFTLDAPSSGYLDVLEFPYFLHVLTISNIPLNSSFVAVIYSLCYARQSCRAFVTRKIQKTQMFFVVTYGDCKLELT